MLVLGAPAGGAIVICGATMCVCCRRPLHDCFSHQRAQQDSRRQARASTSRCAHLHHCLTPAKKPAKPDAARSSGDALVHVDTPLQLYHSHFCCCRGPQQLTAGSSARQSSARNGSAGRTNHGLAPKAKLELTKAIQDSMICFAAAPGAINGTRFGTVRDQGCCCRYCCCKHCGAGCSGCCIAPHCCNALYKSDTVAAWPWIVGGTARRQPLHRTRHTP